MMFLPKMLLSMHVLQLNVMDLRTFLQAELEENPLLDEEEQVSEATDEDERRLDEEISGLVDDRVDNEELVLGSGDERPAISEEKKSYLESLITGRESLYEHLHWQLEVLAKDEEQKRIGEFLIGSLDSDGYLKIDLIEVPRLLNASFEDVRDALCLIRTFEPAGVAARELKESLLIQLINAGKGNSHIYRIVYSHLEDLEKGNLDKIAKELSIPLKEVEAAKKRLSYLNPRPGANFGKDVAMRVIPDVIAYKNNGGYYLEVNERDLPRLYVSPLYNVTLKNRKSPQETKDYIRKKLTRARWVIDSVKQRKNTISRVCEYLFDIQKGFLDGRDNFAKPLILKQVADSLSISEATVSRTVSNKYLQTATQLFALKRFFARGLKQEKGEISSLKIKQRIKELIENENERRPLKDEDIDSLLRKEGIDISRRTVAKYRDSLNILSFKMRKK
jgi:RNA polymerase sigma-54 factor